MEQDLTVNKPPQDSTRFVHLVLGYRCKIIEQLLEPFRDIRQERGHLFEHLVLALNRLDQLSSFSFSLFQCRFSADGDNTRLDGRHDVFDFSLYRPEGALWPESAQASWSVVVPLRAERPLV